VKEPQATFSACFGAVFLVWHPSRYAQMLGRLLEKHNVQTWLVNTGWTGGPYGVGERMKLGHTRAMVRAALAGELTGAPTTTDPMFGLAVPRSIRDVPGTLLSPRSTWSDPTAYDAQARTLAQMFAKNFEQFASGVDQAVRDAGPRG
jgi:phosphoenolpyruvate carboxykinase (ATP)